MIKKMMTAAMAATMLACGMAGAAETQSAAGFQPMSVTQDGLEGPGAVLLLERLPDAQFILVGEDHGFAGSPQITAALAKSAAKYGVVHHVIEVGPYTVRWASDVLKRDGVEGLAEAFKGRPLMAPFLNMREDAELAAGVLKNGGDLWGVDQEFIGSTLLHFQTLHDHAKSEAAKKRLADLLSAETDAFATGNQGALFMFTVTDDVFAELESYFPRDKEALALLAALRESADIYQAYARGDNYVSNIDRVALIKRQFLQAYGAARGQAPRAIFKMGANHVGLGMTYLNTFDVGSLVEGVAAANGLQVLRVAIYPLAGKATQISPSEDGAFSIVDYSSEEMAVLIGLAGVEVDSVPEDGWAVIALDPVRRKIGQKAINALSPEVKFMLLGYDFLVTTRDAKAATPLAD